jgi:hypothetical protein
MFYLFQKIVVVAHIAVIRLQMDSGLRLERYVQILIVK